MNNKSFLVLSHDERQVAIYQFLLSKGLPAIFYDSSCANASIRSYVEASDVIICPTPFTGKWTNDILESVKPYQYVFGGKLPFGFIKECEAKGAYVYDLLKNDILSNINALYTAEGTIGHIIMSTPFSLFGANCLVTGYGKCGKHLTKLLKTMGANVDIFDNDNNCIIVATSYGISGYTSVNEINLSKYNLIINTIPHNIFNAEHIESISENCYIFDIASAPYGFNDDICKNISHMMRLPGIPGKITPVSAGELICKIILSTLE